MGSGQVMTKKNIIGSVIIIPFIIFVIYYIINFDIVEFSKRALSEPSLIKSFEIEITDREFNNQIIKLDSFSVIEIDELYEILRSLPEANVNRMKIFPQKEALIKLLSYSGETGEIRVYFNCKEMKDKVSTVKSFLGTEVYSDKMHFWLYKILDERDLKMYCNDN